MPSFCENLTTEEKFNESTQGQVQGSKCVPLLVHLLEQYLLFFLHLINNALKYRPSDILLYVINISQRIKPFCFMACITWWAHLADCTLSHPRQWE
jgi:hypothetical protein